MMQPIPLVSGWNLLPFIHFLRGIGAPVGRWLAESRIRPGLLAEPDEPIPLVHMLDFVERAARAEGAESLAVDVGRQTAAECLGAFGAQLGRCVTLYDRAETTRRLLSLSNNCECIWLEEDGGSVRLHARIDGAHGPGRRHADDFTLMLVLEAIGRAAPPGWKPSAIYLPGTRSHRFARDEQFQGVQMVYGAPNLTIVFAADLLGHPLRPVSPARAAMTDGVTGRLHGREVPVDFVSSLEDAVATLLPTGCPTVGDLADIAGTSPRTLQRRVTACGTSLRQVVDRTRFLLAHEFLQDPAASVTDIALELGYSDSTAFARAFRRVAGVPPTRYRDRRLHA